NRLKTPTLRKQLHKYVTAMPTFVDGKMQPHEWIQTPEGILKIHLEHHNFGGAEPDLVDPAYDLSSAILEFGLSSDGEQELLRLYQQQCGDTSIGERILLHKILYGSMVMRHARSNAAAGREPEKNNRRHQHARNF